ncbi:biotin carboxylase [Embleya sp. NBC_00888]|uniref:ATP-grasp domain-containing protein n=1 Tax=Embleya sp. NBC_00888 TaxID=2975960 RepID=UPI00386A8A6B|nr:biotin carboxylase [Embleya sp. NBC_00888]
MKATYITALGTGSNLPEGATEIIVVPNTEDYDVVRAAACDLAQRHGPMDRIVALYEDDLLVAARLREEWGCPGPELDQTLRFRDKLTMSELVAGAGIALPAFADAASEQDVICFAETHGWPVIVKPRIGSSSLGVVLAAKPGDLANIEFSLQTPMLVQAFNSNPVFHVDGLYQGGKLGPWRCSRYLNTCLDFQVGKALASTEEDDPALTQAIGDFTTRVVESLAYDRTSIVFHLEVFVERTGRSAGIQFLEIGARVGGGGIPFVWREVHGYDLMADMFAIAMGEDPPTGRAAFHTGESAGWLLVQTPLKRPCRITGVRSMTGAVPGPYAEVLPEAGEVLPLTEAFFEHVGGQFRFRGHSASAVDEAIRATIDHYRVSAVPAQ